MIEKQIMKNKAFTLIEIMVWILIFTIIIISWFQVLNSLMFWKLKLIEKTNVEKEAYYFSEKFFDMIKKWWTIDYEEYWNRRVVWTSYSSWHYAIATWFWNFGHSWNVWTTVYGNHYYYCLSWDVAWCWSSMWTGWCLTDTNTWSLWVNQNYSWSPQRYGQYSFHFIDYNSNHDNDWWDENWNWDFMWDDDDEYLWEWPEVFSGWLRMKDLYLINWQRNKRTLFRWSVKTDPPYIPCDYSNHSNPTGTGCLWTVEFLKLDWKDRGMDHNVLSIDLDWTQYDGIVDTWIIDPDFTWWAEIVAWSNTNNYWQPIFPSLIDVDSMNIELYPNKSLEYAWRDFSPEVNLSPYLRIQLILTPSRKTKSRLKWKTSTIEINTTINLTDIFSN